MKLDLGCGTRRHHPDAIGIDKLDLREYHPEGKFMQADLNDTFIWKELLWDGTNKPNVDEVWATDILEHLDDFVKVMEAIWDVCVNGAKVHILVPHEKSEWAWGDPTHKRAFNEWTFRFFKKGNLVNGTRYGFLCDFNILENCRYKDIYLKVELEVVKPCRWDKVKHFDKFGGG